MPEVQFTPIKGQRPGNNMGHRFGPELACTNPGCRQTWKQQQYFPTECRGPEPVVRNVRHIGNLCHQHGITNGMIGERAEVGKETVRRKLATTSDDTTGTFAAVMAAAIELLRERGVEIPDESSGN